MTFYSKYIAGVLGISMLFGGFTAYAESGSDYNYSVQDAKGEYGSSTHVLKADIAGRDAQDYQVFWQVDDGEWHWMSSDDDGRHAFVDISDWDWNGKGPYTIAFIFRENDKTVLATKEVQIYNESSGAGISNQSGESVQTLSLNHSIENANGRYGNATHLFKGNIPELTLNDYLVFWQVEDGSLNVLKSEGDYKRAYVDISFWDWLGEGPYNITFVFEEKDGTLIGKETVQIFNDAVAILDETDNAETLSDLGADSIVENPVEEVPVKNPDEFGGPSTNPLGGNPLEGLGLHAKAYSPFSDQYEKWKNERPIDAAIMKKMSEIPRASWFGSWNKDIQADVNKLVTAASAAGEMPVLVAYNIPFRDCGGYSSGGASTAGDYKKWIESFSAGIGNSSAVVVLEPDALAAIDCLSDSQKQEREGLLSFAVDTLKARQNTYVYADAGHARWKTPETMAERLGKIGIGKADGFAINVSNFISTADNIAYGQKISEALGRATHFVIDTGRNGGKASSSSEWCNPEGKSLGKESTTDTGEYLVDAFLWIKTPGESDGSCNGGPSAGVWWPEYALDLAKRAGW